MNDTIDVVWWITAVELPVLAGLYWLIARLRKDSEDALEALRVRAETAQARVRESLAAYKLEVAKTYVSTGMLKDVETRLTDHLLRIERKLEGGAAVPEGGRR